MPSLRAGEGSRRDRHQHGDISDVGVRNDAALRKWPSADSSSPSAEVVCDLRAAHEKSAELLFPKDKTTVEGAAPSTPPSSFQAAAQISRSSRTLTSHLGRWDSLTAGTSSALHQVDSDAFTCIDSRASGNNSDILDKLLHSELLGAVGAATAAGGAGGLQVLQQDLQNLTLIGRGGGGIVFRAEWRGAQVALKVRFN